jgi:hopanoid biosynthesis associated protein HpnK
MKKHAFRPYCATGSRGAQTTTGSGPATARPPQASIELIINADDFGRTETINAAIAQAHSEGILTSASLMVTAEAAADAVRVAQAHPGLAVGLHIVVLGGRAALPAARIPHLVDGQGRFSHRAFRAGIRYFFSRSARAELDSELRAQFEAFRATGLRLSHVDGHHHMHLHPAVFRLLVPLAHEYGAPAVRLNISDELLFSLRIDRRDALLKLGWKIAFAGLERWCRHSLRQHPLPAADRVYGVMQTGHLTEAYLVQLLDRLVTVYALSAGSGAGAEAISGAQAPGAMDVAAGGPVVEVFCHPSLRRESSRLGPNPGDLRTLLSRVTRAAADRNGLLLTTYPAVRAAGVAPPLSSGRSSG